MKRAILFGYGNIGKVLGSKLSEENISLQYIVTSKGIFNSELVKQGDLSDWKNFANEIDVAFITIPTTGEGEIAFEYEKFFLEKNIPVVTCEKASVAYNFEYLKKFKNFFKYNASVGGGTRMLQKILEYKKENIKEIKGVMNGTLNFIGDSLKKGKERDQIVKEILEKGFAEPGATNFEEIIKGEVNDVKLKTTIIANMSGLFSKVMKPEDLAFNMADPAKRCIVKMNERGIEVGFLEENDNDWLPDGVNNVLYVNGEKQCEGPGAGRDATVGSMIADLKSLS